jgi:peptidoglycan/LPS O-acetylase OafA/YrhL
MMRRLLRANGLAILAVILFHAAGWGFTAMFAWGGGAAGAQGPDFSQSGSAAYYALRGLEQFTAFGLAAFLFVSGYFAAFAAGRSGEKIPWSAVGARIKSLVVPYLFWSTLLLFGLLLQGNSFSPATVLRMFLTGAVNPAYYFVPLLIQFYLLAPILAGPAKRYPGLLLLATGLVQVFVYAMQYPILLSPESEAARLLTVWLPKWIFPVKLFWFTLGIVAGFHLPTVRTRLEKWRWAFLGAAAGLFVLGAVEWESLLRLSGRPWLDVRETLIDGLYAGAVILALVSFSEVRGRLTNLVEGVGSRSYGIYLVHSPAMELVSRGLYHLAPAVLAYQVLFQPLLVVFGLGVPLALMFVVKNTRARVLYSYQFG